jgi:hypothetical protein
MARTDVKKTIATPLSSIPTYIHTYICNVLHSCIVAYLHTYILTYLHTHLHTYSYIPTYILVRICTIYTCTVCQYAVEAKLRTCVMCTTSCVLDEGLDLGEGILGASAVADRLGGTRQAGVRK